MIALSILAILSTVAVGSYKSLLDRQRLKAAGETIFADLRLAQSEAIKQNKKIFVSFKNQSSGWCYGISNTRPCDCRSADQCKINNVSSITRSNQFRGVSLQKARFAGGTDYTAFDPVKGFAVADGVKNGSIWLKSKDDSLAVIINRLGRIRFCSKTLADYPNRCTPLK